MIRILYALQGTGNGHISRANALIPIFEQYGKVDVLVSGTHSEISLNRTLTYKLHGLGFFFGKNGGIDLLKTLRNLKPLTLLADVRQLPLREYDLIVNDFEPVTAWACKLLNIPSYGLSHQHAVLDSLSPKPKKRDFIATLVLKYYAPTTFNYGFHFRAYNESIFEPIVRDSIRSLKCSNNGHYVIYLPAYSDEKILSICRKLPHEFIIFSKHTKNSYANDNCCIKPIQNEQFLQALASAEGMICGAGFEGPSEALFLGKKLLVVPMKNQYEQQCNAAALEQLGISVIKSFNKYNIDAIKKFLHSKERKQLIYEDRRKAVVEDILNRYYSNSTADFMLTSS